MTRIRCKICGKEFMDEDEFMDHVEKVHRGVIAFLQSRGESFNHIVRTLEYRKRSDQIQIPRDPWDDRKGPADSDLLDLDG